MPRNAGKMMYLRFIIILFTVTSALAVARAPAPSVLGERVLRHAMGYTHIEVVKLLLEYGADTNAVDTVGRIVLMEAGFLVGNRVRRINAASFEENVTEQEHTVAAMPSLLEAAEQGDVESVRQRLSQGDDVNTTGLFDVTAMMLAAEHGHLEVMQILREEGAAVNAVDEFGLNAAMRAVLGGSVEALQVLVQWGTDIGHVTNYGSSALALAVESKKLPAVQVLLASGADPEFVRDDITMLKLAAKLGATDIIKELVRYGVDIHRVVGDYTALMFAITHVQHEVMRVLSDYGAELTAAQRTQLLDREIDVEEIMRAARGA